MKLPAFLTLALGRLVLPMRAAAPGTPYIGELWMLAAGLYFRNLDDDATLRLLTDAEKGVANGVATLGADGLVPGAQLPGSVTGTRVPIGASLWWPGDPESIPSNFLVEDGSEYLRTDYPELAALLRTRYGYPTNDLYFRVPDSIGRNKVGAWSYPNSGLVRRVDIFTRGQGYTPGTYSFTFTGGSFSTAATGRVVIANETVPGVGTTGVVQSVEIVTPGLYTDLGTASSTPGASAANCALTVPVSALPGGTGFVYDVRAQPVAAVRPAYAWSIEVTDHGTSYTTPPKVVISGASLTGATAYAVVRDGGVSEIIVTSPGVGSTSGATVTLTGGDGTGATAQIRVEDRHVLSGDYLGAEGHLPLVSELPAHHHVGKNVTGAGTGLDTPGSYGPIDADTDDTGDDYPMPMRPAAVGFIPIICAS